MSLPDQVKCVFAHQLYDGSSDAPRLEQIVEIESGRIARVRDARAGEHLEMPAAAIIAPGFIDMQINGAADAQFNFAPSLETLETIAHGARQGGTAHVLPTFITAPGRDYRAALAAGRAALEARVPGILGVHLEGPFLSPKKPGIHPAHAIRALDEQDLSCLCEAFPGVLLLTLAPECQPDGALRRLASAGVRVSVGHSAADLGEVRSAEADGLTLATHLFNAMGPIEGRIPGVVGAVLTSKTLFAGIIADGVHVDWANISLAHSMMGKRLCAVTDAMLTLAGTTREFDLYGQKVFRADGRLANSDGRLAGAHVAMDETVRNLIHYVGLSLGQALAMASANPARALGLEMELGQIAPGYRASLTLLDSALAARGVCVDGLLF
ncbi:N-acetylglucosamine-6-phosphate deacetylase [Sulfitobacter sp. TB366]|uniref:N-acetylglucosamine-6-phosphate deacetylase n=1 Tax=unclassified Sulfitobacter TaxID=196795 RepID=UPI003745B50F